MLIKRDCPTTEGCDICGEHKPLPLAHVAQGATGRWCEVLWTCTDCASEGDAVPAEQARDQIERSGDGWPEF